MVFKADEFRRHAEQCRAWADKAPGDDQKAMWLKLAEHWDHLADSLEPASETNIPQTHRSGGPERG
jgi:hypothetical protein